MSSALLVCAPLAGAWAQTVTLGGSGRPAVEINLDAIYGTRDSERLLAVPGGGPTQAAPQSLRIPNYDSGSGERIVLRPPAERGAARSGSVRLKPPPATRAPQVAAKPPAAPKPAAPKPAAAPAEPKPAAPAAAPKTVAPPAAKVEAADDDGPAMPAVPRGQLTARDVAPPPPEPKAPAASAAPQRVAALPQGDGQELQIRFRSGSAALAADDEARLAALAEQLRGSDQRLQLRAFAEENGSGSSRARRLSLSRALAVRSYLIENGMRSTRIDVRALGIARDGGPPDRVDVILLSQ